MKHLELTTKKYKYCLRCGRLLKSEENKIRGMGKSCWEKSQAQKLGKPLVGLVNNETKKI